MWLGAQRTSNNDFIEAEGSWWMGQESHETVSAFETLPKAVEELVELGPRSRLSKSSYHDHST
jgi:hypothetical protein